MTANSAITAPSVNGMAPTTQQLLQRHDPCKMDAQGCQYFASCSAPEEDMLTTPLLAVGGDDRTTSSSSDFPNCSRVVSSSLDGQIILNEDDTNSGDASNSCSVAIAAIFLNDYEHSRPCSLPTNITQIKLIHVKIHRIRHSFLWQCILYTAVGCLFLSSCFDGQSGWRHAGHEDLTQLVLTVLSAIVLTVDLFMTTSTSSGCSCGSRTSHNTAEKHQEECSADQDGNGDFDGDDNHDEDDEYGAEDDEIIFQTEDDDTVTFNNTSHRHRHRHRHRQYKPIKTKNRVRYWKMPLLCMLLGVALETWLKMILDEKKCVWTGCLKPVVFFYASSKARDALTALYHVSRIVLRIIFIELFLLLSFASMACHLYFKFDSYRDLPTAFLSLFEIQTTAATPGLWIPVYDKDRSSAIFFVLFLIICVFFVHSVVLSVVFQTYIHSMKILRERAAADRLESMKLAYLALAPINLVMVEVGHEASVETDKVRQVIQILRPHYSSEKIDVLMQIVDPNRTGRIEYSDFRVRMPVVLRTSLRSARPTSRHSMVLSSLTISVAISNMVYVLLFSSSPFEFVRLSYLIFPMGTIITLVGLVEVITRLRPFVILHSLSTSRHGVLDTLAIIAGIVSITGIISHAMKDSKGLQWLLLGRAIDMIRVMRLSTIFRSIVKRSGEVLPALVGPLALVLTSLHIFTYSGMVIWGGAISVGAHNDRVTPLYDLNNFNDYPSGLLTMFNILVVNDWQTIAGVYLTADRFSSPFIVYPFFIGANLIGVNIFLNVLTAFFVGAFVTKVEKKNLGRRDDLQLSMSMRIDALHDNIPVSSNNQQGDSAPIFHILERRGYDNVISTITGDEALDIVTKACGILKTFERLVPLENEIGYLIAYHECKDYIVNHGFPGIVKGFIKYDDDLQSTLSELFIKLSEKEFGSDVRKEYYDYGGHRKLVLTASFCSQNPTMILIVANIAENVE